METTIRACLLGAIVLAAICIMTVKKIKKKISWREVVTGTLIYFLGRYLLSNAVSGMLGNFMYTPGGMIVKTVLDALILVSGFVIVYHVFYRNNMNSIVAFSLGAGAFIPEIFFSYIYTLLNEGTILNAIYKGSANELFSSQGVSEDLSIQLINYFKSINTASVISLTFQGIGCAAVSLLVSILVYSSYCKKDKKYLAYACIVPILFETASITISVLSVIGGIIAMILFFVSVYVYVAGIQNNVIANAWNKDEQVKSIKANQKERRCTV